ncbi:MAG: hypothetical protein GWN84_14585 [Gammaproteobacteria bacterium]|nr:hypothetical protein [Gammaproteobacteria bacterium]NIR84027.1 hypothetical protein [Gammaproteobacteria bacterium]NIR89171.1 hypothetical protein [Gammaproteobacteria bacterium]NIU04973.1 hypothetical protein [Gammaproteobacteria bacterium]NIV52139.1 hypothetical protein [Gammaproteobacteria bacterium]
MPSFRHRVAVYVLAVGLVLSGGVMRGALASSHGEPPAKGAPPAEAMVVDLLLVRPVMLATTAVGTALFALSLPFTVPAGNADQVQQRLVVEPARYTFVRPLGAFDR